MTAPLSRMTVGRYGNTSMVRWFLKETITDDTSDPVIIPPSERDVAIYVDPGTNAKVEFTISSYQDIQADNAIWVDWDAGSVTVGTFATLSAFVTAVRLVSVGASSWQVTT